MLILPIIMMKNGMAAASILNGNHETFLNIEHSFAEIYDKLSK